MDQETADRLTKSYVEWKRWSLEAAPTYVNSIYAEEAARAELAAGASVLEIGFGEGTFLDWARAQGFACCGIEINQDLVESARARGHTVHHGHLGGAAVLDAEQFDAVFLFDVLEHVQLDEIVRLFDELHRVLRHDGKVVARFPNGASPFGRAYQYGDATHVTVLTGSMLAQIGAATGFDLVGQYNAARGTKSRSGGIRNIRALRAIAFVVRDIVQLVVGLVYFGKNVPMDPNMTAILRKRDRRPGRT